ncbi:MAG: peptidoglycan-binding domain-containing protein, partial [Geminicoccaceae bacterium]
PLPLAAQPALTALDERLAKWPPYAVGIDLPPGTAEIPPAEPAPSVDNADATSVDSTAPIDEPPAPIEDAFVETVSKVRWLQSALTVDNRNPGPIDGAIGKRTMEAIRSWRQDNGRADRAGALTEVEFQRIIEAFGRRFDQVQAKARSF